MITINEMIEKLDALDETDSKSWKKAEELFRTEDFDFSRLGGLSKDIERGVELHQMSPFAIANTMFVLIATAAGRYTELQSNHADKRVKPSLYVINGAGSGQGKSGMYEWMANPTIIKEKDILSDHHEEVMEQIDNDNSLNNENKDSEKKKKHMKHVEMVTSNYTIQSLLHNLRNSAVLVNFDELGEFWKTNCPERGTSLMPELTRLQTIGRTDVSRIAYDLRNSKDGALNIYAHGTLKLVQKFFDGEWPIEGTSYRFLMTLSDRKSRTLYKKAGASQRRNDAPENQGPPVEFIKIFNKVFNKCFKNELYTDNTEPLFNSKNRNTYNYTSHARALKSDISNCILNTLETLADESGDKGKDIKMTMILKIHNFIDKFALIFQLIRDAQSTKDDIDSLFDSSSTINNPVDSESVELAFNYMRVMFNNWLVILGSKPAIAEDLGAIKAEEGNKIPTAITFVKKALDWKSDNWLTYEEIDLKLKELPRTERTRISKFRNLLRTAKDGSPWILIKDNKYNLI